MLKTQQQIRRETQDAFKRLEDMIAEENIKAFIRAEEVAKFVTQPMDLSKFEEEKQA